MKPYLFPFRLYPEDDKRRKLLVKRVRDASGRKMAFADILRELMAEKVAAISHKKQ
jgi:hypothetical protein